MAPTWSMNAGMGRRTCCADTLKYATTFSLSTAKNNLGVLSFILAAVGFVLIGFSYLNLKSPSYQYYTDAAFGLLIASIASGAIAKRRSKQAEKKP